MLFLCGTLGPLGLCNAAQLEVRVSDREGRPVSDVVVVAAAISLPAQTTPKSQPKTAVMDQIDKQFVPRILIVQAGTAIAFPNSDPVSHQVYSFSPARRFQLALYRSHVYPPLVFDRPGIVVLGCNIHDSMIGYIYVAPSPYFGKTDASGKAVLVDLPAAAYEVSVWNPRFNEPQTEIKQKADVSIASEASLDVRLTRELRPEIKSKQGRKYGNDY